MGADREQQNCLGPIMRYKFEEYPQVLSGTAGPNAVQIAFEFMRFELRIESVRGQQQ
jgi:hypothetical protein